MIGDWDDSNCVFAILPACLAVGTNPASFISGNFPVYQGPAASGIITAAMQNFDSGNGYRSANNDIMFDGSDDVIATNVSVTASATGGFTFFWRHNAANDGSTLYPFGSYVDDLHWLSLSMNQSIDGATSWLANGAGLASWFSVTNLTSNSSLVWGQENSFCWTVSNGVHQFYVNGLEVSAYNSRKNYTAADYVNQNLKIGYDEKANYLNKNLDQLILYNVALSAAQILSLHNLGADLGLKGFDSGDNTMAVIGNIDTEHKGIGTIGLKL